MLVRFGPRQLQLLLKKLQIESLVSPTPFDCIAASTSVELTEA